MRESDIVFEKGPYWVALFTVYGGLHHIKGNHAPYFSLTMSKADACIAKHNLVVFGDPWSIPTQTI